MLYHTRNFIQCFCCWNWPLYYTKIVFFLFWLISTYIKHSFSRIPKNIPVSLIEINYLIFNFVSKFKFHTPIWFEVGLHSWRKSLFQDRSDFRRDLRFPFHYFIFIYFRCLISNIYLLSVYNESSQGSLVSISCYFLYLL